MARVDEKIKTKVITNEVRLSYVHLLEPYAQDKDKDEPMYSCLLLIPKSDKETLSCLVSAQKEAYETAKGDKLKGLKFDAVDQTLHDGEEKYDIAERPEYEGMMICNVRSKLPPQIIDKYKEKVETKEEVYSGVYARVSVNAYAYNTGKKRGITFGLNNVQITRKGEPLGGRASAQDDFDEWLEDDNDDMDLLG
jgi:hypothetical protein